MYGEMRDEGVTEFGYNKKYVSKGGPWILSDGIDFP